MRRRDAHARDPDRAEGREGFHSRGAPLIRVSMEQVEAAGVQRLPRITGVADGQPIADGAAVPRPATVIWATGYRPGLDWIAVLTPTQNRANSAV